MRISTIVALVVVLIPQFMFSACKKTEPPGAKPSTSQQAHVQEMVQKSFAESKKAVAATVNGEVISMFTLLREMNAIAPQYVPAGQPATPEINAKIRKDALNTLITQLLAVQEAIKRGMKVRPEAIEEEIKKLKAGKGSEAGYQEYLGNQGLTENDLRKIIENDQLFEMIASQEIDAKITVTDAALRERYKKEKAGMKDSSHQNMSFDAAKGMLELKVRADAGEKRMREWEQELRKDARIEIIEQKQKQG